MGAVINGAIGEVRKNLAEYILNCSTNELMTVLTALESDNEIPNFFSCETCTKHFGKCTLFTKCDCAERLEKYEKMTTTQNFE